MSIDLRLLAVLDPAALGGRDLVSAARAAEAGGATALQLRLKNAPAGSVFEAARQLLAALSIPVTVNDRADVALGAGAHGVHLGQDDVPVGLLRALVPPGFQIGLSVGSPAEAEVAARAAPDYWSVGPLYPTASKADAGVPLGAAGFRALARRAPPGLTVIAIGGITPANVGDVIAAGAAGVAVIGALFAADDVAAATRTMRSAIDAALARRPVPPGSR